MKTFNNFKELMEYDSELAQELLKEKGKGKWQEEEIYYESIEDFAEYSAWYANTVKDDYDGTPNPLDFINLEEFGKALIGNWNDSVYYKTSNDEILRTAYEW